MALRPCNAQYCLKALDGILAFCKNHKWPVARPIVAKDDQGPGFIMCPFVSAGIKVQQSLNKSGSIESIDKNDSVLVAHGDLQWQPAAVERTQSSTGIEHLLYAVLIKYDGGGLVVTGDHIFMLANGKLITADRLTKQDSLMSSNGKSVPIDSVYVGAYKSRFQHISTSDLHGAKDFRKYVATNGIISGDPTMIFFLYDGSLDPYLVEDWEKMPLIGSHKYIKKYGDECLDAPVGNLGNISVVEKWPVLGSTSAPGHYFLPAKKSVVPIPPDDMSLVPFEDAVVQLEEVDGELSDRILEYDVRDMMAKFANIYTDIQFDLDWIEELPDGRASKNPKRILIFGGLARHMDLELQGLALMIAHEVGHHIGGGHTSQRSGLHCEGQSDFNAIGIMRTVYPSAFESVIPQAIEQAANFFDAFDCVEPMPEEVSNCRHPSACCRIATLRSALELQVEPPPCAV